MLVLLVLVACHMNIKPAFWSIHSSIPSLPGYKITTNSFYKKTPIYIYMFFIVKFNSINLFNRIIDNSIDRQ